MHKNMPKMNRNYPNVFMATPVHSCYFTPLETTNRQGYIQQLLGDWVFHGVSIDVWSILCIVWLLQQERVHLGGLKPETTLPSMHPCPHREQHRCSVVIICLLYSSKAQQIKQVTVLFNSLTPVNFLRNLSAFIRSYIINKN